MNKIVSKMIFGAALLILAACTQDEMTDNGNALPEGKYPLQIASVTMDVTHSQQPWGADAPQTRVSENTDRNSSVWDGGEKIGVQIANGTETAVYILQDDKKTLSSDDPLYWKNTTSAKVRAWYPADGKVYLDNQTNRLAYALFAETTNAVDYNTKGIALPFEHKLAKVRVVLEGSDKDKVDDVMIKAHTFCTLGADGVVTAGDTKDYISMMPVTATDGSNGIAYWEANVVPTEAVTDGYNILDFKLKIKDTNTYKESKLDNGGMAPAKAKVNTITLTVGNIEIKGGETIDKPGNYIIKSSITQGVTLNGDNIKLTLDGVTANIGNAIKVTGGSPTLIVKGTNNSFNGDGAGILISPNASVTIEGATDNASDSKLTIKAGLSVQPGIGCTDQESCENITIKNVTLDVTGGSKGVDGGAAIGTAGNYGSSVNDILIENSIVTATGGKGAAAIGFGTIIKSNYSINSIKIINSQITAIVQYQSYPGQQTYGYAAGIGFPYAAEEHVLTIKQPIEIISTETDPEKYFSSFKAMKDENIVTEEIRKVGKPIYEHSHSVFSWQGAKFNEQTLGDNNVGY